MAKQLPKQPPKRLILGIAGASGVIYGIRALEILKRTGIETHLVMSSAAELTMTYETDVKPKAVREMATVFHAIGDVGASISSGSFKTEGMLILPCSVHTMSEIAHGVTDNLLSRAADVVLKERRRLVIALRETPLHGGHLRTMVQLSDMGAIISPIVPAFYTRPKTIEDIVDHSIGRLLDLFGIDTGTVHRWKEPADDAPSGMRNAKAKEPR
jgi:4-hydroxy-3-polyprenylbenzoate decarboxylase